MNVQKTKERVLTAAAIIGLIAAGLLFWQLVAAFMWWCYDLGIPM